MSYFAEGWFLFRKTWWATLRLILLGALLISPVLIITGIVKPILGPLIMLALMLVVVPPWLYAWFSVVSGPFYAEKQQVWRLFRTGFSHWARLTGVSLFGLLFSLPFMAASAAAGIFMLDLLPPGQEGFAAVAPSMVNFFWISFVVSLFYVVLGMYGALAGLNAVRTGSTAWRSWLNGFRLIPRRDLLRTFGIVFACEAAYRLIETLNSVSQIPQVTAGTPGPSPGPMGVVGGLLLGIATWLVSWYLGLCVVAIWHRYAVPPATESPVPAAEPLDPDPQST